MQMKRTVLITGGARGIGKAIADHYASKGWCVVAPTRSECDLSSETAILDWLSKRPLRVDALINNAGINRISLLQDSQTEDWRGTLSLNLLAPVILSKGSLYLHEGAAMGPNC